MTGLVRRFAAGNAILPGARVPFFGSKGPADGRGLEKIGKRAFPSNDDWPARNQGPSRGTCNAFAMVAAEELWNFRQNNETLADFSEEYLYTSVRSRNDLERLKLDAEQEAKLRGSMVEDGSTFLFQVQEVLPVDGLVARDAIEYDADPARPANYKVSIPDGLTTVQINATLVHDIDTNHPKSARSPQIWCSGDTRSASERIREALAGGAPVVAAFYLLDYPYDTAWYGLSAQVYGLVRYPVAAAFDTLRVIGAHSVCIVDFEIDDDTGEQMFIFRNSWGQHEFGSAPWKRQSGIRAPHRGYGLISADAVDQYCWEFLHREVVPANTM